MELIRRFTDNCTEQHLFEIGDRLLLAVSGGVDSVALCDLCAKSGLNFGIAHCNFQLRGNDSARDEAFVNSLAKRYEVPFYFIRFETKTFAAENKVSTQVAARTLRYRWFDEMLQKEGFTYLLTAHHADDNVETVCMNFFRGTGIQGLTGIRPKSGKTIRPLLFARRHELEAYLTENNLPFVQDESNLHDDYTRNYFRNTILPLIVKSYPEVFNNITSNIDRLNDANELYNEAVRLHKKKLLKKSGDELHVPVLLLQKTRAAKTVLFEIIKEMGFGASQLQEVWSLVESESGRYIKSATHRILKDRKHLIITPLDDDIRSATVIESPGEYSFKRGSLWLSIKNRVGLKFSDDNEVVIVDAVKAAFPLILRPWKQGDYFYPLGMLKKKKLSRFFIDNKLSLAEKEKIWVLEMNKKVIWVVGHRIDNRFKVTDRTQNVLQIRVKFENR